MDFQPSARKHTHRPCSCSPGLLQVLIIFASLASPSVSEFTAADGCEGKSSKFVDVNVDEESVHPSASQRLEIGKSGINIPLEELRVPNVEQRDVHIHLDMHLDMHIDVHVKDQPSPNATSWSLGRKSLGCDHYNARKLSEVGRNPTPGYGTVPPPGRRR